MKVVFRSLITPKSLISYFSQTNSQLTKKYSGENVHKVTSIDKFIFDDEDLWNENDYVSLIIKKENIKLTLK